MFDFSFLDIRLLFPNISEEWALVIELVAGWINAISIIMILIAEWKLFKKFWEKSWKSLVPYYNSYILYKYTWNKNVFWVYLVSSTLLDITQLISDLISQSQPESMWLTLLVLIALPVSIVSAVCSILYTFRLAEAFGKRKAFSVGLLLAYSVFISILGFGKSKYIGSCDEVQRMNEAERSDDNVEVG